MAIYYEKLDEQTRHFMMKEMEFDLSNGTLYISTRLNEIGVRDYPLLLKEAIQNYDDSWLAGELRRMGLMKPFEQRRRPKGGFTTAQVPVTAPDTLAEGEFNRFYARGLCARAIEDEVQEVEVYRGKQVSRPRPESEAMIGKRIPAKDLLTDLRQSQGVEPALGLPPGPNSGLTVRLPFA